MEEAILEMIVEMAVSEVMHCILATKCCRWSKKKWEKIKGQVEHQREDRKERITERLRPALADAVKDSARWRDTRGRLDPGVKPDAQDIMDYAVKISNV